MPLNRSILEQGFKDLADNGAQTSFEFATKFTDFYVRYALTAAPLPVVAPKRAVLQATLATAFLGPGSPDKCINAFVSGLTAFWIGTPVPGGAVTAFLGAPVLIPVLVTLLPGIPAPAAIQQLTTAFDAATRLVQYVIPPGGPLFLV